MSSGEWFHWHYDRWTPPALATEIARNAAASQAFVLRRSLAVQFHPELGTAMLQGWLDQGGHRKAVELGLDPDHLLAQTRQREASARERAHRLVDAFLDVVAVQPYRVGDGAVRPRPRGSGRQRARRASAAFGPAEAEHRLGVLDRAFDDLDRAGGDE